MATQSWNNLIKHIKNNLGAPLNFLEYNDAQIIDIIKENILPIVSGKRGKIEYRQISETNRDNSQQYRGLNVYKIPTENSDGSFIEIIDIIEVSYNINNSSIFPEPYNIGLMDPHEVVMYNTTKDAYDYLSVKQSHEFIHPHFIKFQMELMGPATLECKCIHTNLDTIPTAIYNDILKDLCVATIQEHLCAMRGKYEILSTPIGDIKLNIQDMKENARALREKAETKLNDLSPDILIGFI
jgi:hypothetical protein